MGSASGQELRGGCSKEGGEGASLGPRIKSVFPESQAARSAEAWAQDHGSDGLSLYRWTDRSSERRERGSIWMACRRYDNLARYVEQAEQSTISQSRGMMETLYMCSDQLKILQGENLLNYVGGPRTVTGSERNDKFTVTGRYSRLLAMNMEDKARSHGMQAASGSQ